MKCALVRKLDNIVENIIVANPLTDKSPYDNMYLISVEDNVHVGWVKSGNVFINPNPPPPPPTPTFEELKSKKYNDLANTRWQKETGGTTFNGSLLSTDPVSQTKYVGAVVGAQLDPSAILNWKMADGSFVELDASEITAIAMAVRAHIQACFDREAELRALIDVAVDQEDLDAIDITTGWPS
jgi:hypothetical protein